MTARCPERSKLAVMTCSRWPCRVRSSDDLPRASGFDRVSQPAVWHRPLMRQMRAFLPDPVTTCSPSGLKAAERTGPSCPSKPLNSFGSSSTSSRVARFQMRAVLSQEVVTTKLPVSSKVAEVISLSWVKPEASRSDPTYCGVP